ncbi:MAG: hypothetical protein ABW171_16570 [Steroidobacter sp.]
MFPGTVAANDFVVPPKALPDMELSSFSNYSPFGRSGRFVYGRGSYKF